MFKILKNHPICCISTETDEDFRGSHTILFVRRHISLFGILISRTYKVVIISKQSIECI